ncbi:hypothetical protein QJS04_geneDACA005045 [Acorus gramineus]|uniref:Wall-associated receptor kinase galacturonan-binding domain-containing protein n=1 Tax=Acorus gramineus TaxID=55184 RepID=A0AAV9AZL3_ACOGR|nr:hypothetical protein QJS04_geneDACA005045 [Acorus gramineus]
MHLQCLMINLSLLLLLLLPLPFLLSADSPVNACRSFCGNLTIDYPFSTRRGCGHSAFRDLLFCIEETLMLHIPSGSYRVLDIDYPYQSLTLHDSSMSTCASLIRDGKANGFVVERWRSHFLHPAPDNVFMLIGCKPNSPLFQGFPSKNLPCLRNASVGGGVGCEDYYACPAWEFGPGGGGAAAAPECCAVGFEAVRAINLSRLECEGYSSAYSLAPVKVSGPNDWLYGIRVDYSVPGGYEFCRACEATGGACGHDDSVGVGKGDDGSGDICFCQGWNSTSNCDAVDSSGAVRRISTMNAIFTGFLAGVFIMPIISLGGAMS